MEAEDSMVEAGEAIMADIMAGVIIGVITHIGIPHFFGEGR